MKKVLYISYDGMTDPLGQSQVLPYLVELSKQGYEFTILSFEKRSRYHSEHRTINKITQQASIKWVPLFFTKKPPILSKMYDRWKLLRRAKQLHRGEQFALIHCRSYIAAEAGLMLKKKFGAKFLFDMRGFWANEKIDNGQWNLKNPVYRKIYSHYKKQEKDFLLQANGIVSLTKAGKSYLLAQPGYEQLAIEVIPCCADLQHFDFNRITQQEKQAMKEELGILPEKKVITYLGSIGGWYMTNEMFAFYKTLLSRYPQFVMLILTSDGSEQVIKEGTAAGIDPASIIIRYAKREDVPRYLSISDCSIFFIRPTFSKMASSPTKHAELMGMGIPVICNHIGDTGSIIEETQTGAVISSFDGAAYDKVVEKLPELLSIPKMVIRKAAFDYFDLKTGVEKYAKLYASIIS